jgi:hypothetical protein
MMGGIVYLAEASCAGSSMAIGRAFLSRKTALNEAGLATAVTLQLASKLTVGT